MDKFRAMLVFREIATRGSLSAAANALDISAPSVGRTLASLEKSLGVRLVDRTTRRMALTAEGQQYLEYISQILDLVDRADRQFGKASRDLSGSVSVTAPVMFGQLHVAPLLQEFCANNPQISLKFKLSDRVIDLIDEGIDVAVRIGPYEQSAYHKIKAGTVQQIFCATPEYLRAYGTPQCPQELSLHRCIQFSGVTPGSNWKLTSENIIESISVNYAIRTNDCRAATSACLDGLGVCSFFDYQVRSRILRGTLVEVLSKYRPPPVDVSVVYRNSRQLPQRVTSIADHLRHRLMHVLGPAGVAPTIDRKRQKRS